MKTIHSLIIAIDEYPTPAHRLNGCKNDATAFSEYLGKYAKANGFQYLEKRLYDADAKRFCIPGDLLFAIILAKYGISQHMEFVFSGMVTAGVELVLPEPSGELHINDTNGREYLRVKRAGETTRAESLISNLTQSYVEFSGQTFPHILVPLLAEQGVMIHPERPMVIYESMSIDLDRLDITRPVLQGDISAAAVTYVDGVVNVFAPIAPGIKQLSFSYSLPANAFPLNCPVYVNAPRALSGCSGLNCRWK